MAYCLDGAPGDMRKRMTRDLVFAVAVLVGRILGIRFGLTGVGGGVLGVGLRLGGTALLAHRPYPGFGWMGPLSRRMASRMAAPEIG